MLLNNKKVAKFLGFNTQQMYRLISTGCLQLGICKKNPVFNRYYILECDLEKYIGRKLTEEEREFLYAENK